MNKILIIALVLAIAASLLALSSREEAVETAIGETAIGETATGGIAAGETAADDTVTDALNVSDVEFSVTKITFLELGSTTCIPCVKMKSVLKSISKKYGDQIKVEFIDLKEDRKAARKYEVRMMPTQVFLNEKGEEIHRHLGYYPEAQIDEFLQAQGLKIVEIK